jgi:hypothetical protein
MSYYTPFLLVGVPFSKRGNELNSNSKVLQHMVQIIEDKKGRCLRNGEKRALCNAVEFYYETSDRTDGHVCAICGNGCMESSCTEEICD